jgi:hypothetical protein
MAGTHRKELAMTEPEGTPQDTELAPEPPTDKATNQEAGKEEGGAADYQEAAQEGPTEDYQTRIEKFDEVDASVPVVSLPVKSSDLDKSDLEV